MITINMLTIILVVALIFIWLTGAIVIAFMVWNKNRKIIIQKIIFWPIVILFKN